MTVSHQTTEHAVGANPHESVVKSETVAGLLRIRSEFAFVARGPYDKVAPLFGAEAERVWAGDYWNPRFLYPNPAHDVEGMIFATEMDGLGATWVNTSFDLKTGFIQYVYFVPDMLVTMIDIRVTRQGEFHTGVYVVYTRTSLKPEGNDDVRKRAEHDRNAGEEWRTKINEALKSITSE
ncbi:MAG: hypothetical protein HY851_07500 [candidate division Zixibacteria bacterium]|nr:hypothetical protein [candidate division Zixibacteria bacterium]